MITITFKGKRIDHERFGKENKWVYGHYFKTPLTDENSGTHPEEGWFFLSDGKERHCISDKDGVVYVVIPESVGIDVESLDVGKISLEEYITTVYSRAMNAKDDALGVSCIAEMVDTILGLKK